MSRQVRMEIKAERRKPLDVRQPLVEPSNYRSEIAPILDEALKTGDSAQSVELVCAIMPHPGTITPCNGLFGDSVRRLEGTTSY